MATVAVRGSAVIGTNGSTWASTTNAVDGVVGVNNATYATYTNATASATGYIEIGTFNFSSTVGASDTLNSVTVNLRHFENNTARFTSVVFQAYDGATAIGSAFTATLATAARNDSTTFPVTVAQLRSSTFKIRVTITGAASTQSRIESIDYVDVTADYTVVPPSITQAAWRFYEGDGTETGGTALAAQDTAPTVDASSDLNLQLRMRLQSTTAVAVPSTADFQLQYEKNASGTWTNVVPATTTLIDTVLAANRDGASSMLTNTWMGESFQGNGSNLSRAGFYMTKAPTSEGTLTCRLFAHTGTYGTNGTPTGTALATASNTVDVGTGLTDSPSYTWAYFDFDGTFTLANATPYFITVTSTPTSGSTSIGVDTGGGTSGNGASSADGSTWASTSSERCFEVYSVAPSVVSYGSVNLTDGAATTNRLGAGTGSFVAGKISEDGLVDDLGWTASNYTEALYPVTLKAAALAASDTVRFRVLKNAATTDMTYTATPTVTVTKLSTLSLTLLATDSTTDNSALQTLTSSSFTPTAGAKLYAAAISQNDGNATAQVWSCSGGSLSWTQVAITGMAGFSTYATHTVLYEATVGGSPSSMTVTVDPQAGTVTTYMSLRVFEVTPGADVSYAQAVVVSDTGGSGPSSMASGTLAGSATSGNLSIAILGRSAGTGSPGTPSGWMALALQTAQWTNVNVYYRPDFTGTSVTWTDTGPSFSWGTSILLELTEGAVGGGATATPTVIARVTALPVPTPQAGTVKSAPLIARPVTVPQATATAAVNGTANPAAITASAAIGVTIPQASKTTTPALIARSVGIDPVTASGASAGTAAPAVIARSVGIDPVTASGASAGTAAPAVIARSVGIPATTTQAGLGATATPTVIARNVVLPAPTTSGAGNTSPAVIACAVTVPAATASGASPGTAAPTVIARVVALPAATTQAGSSKSPTVIARSVALPAAIGQASKTITAPLIARSVVISAVTTSSGTGGVAAPAVIARVTVIPAPTPLAGSKALPSVIALSVTLPAPSAGLIASGDATPATITLTLVMSEPRATGAYALYVGTAPVTAAYLGTTLITGNSIHLGDAVGLFAAATFAPQIAALLVAADNLYYGADPVEAIYLGDTLITDVHVGAS